MTGRTKGQFRFTLSCENLTWIAVAVGVILRVWEYVEFRELYMDEVSLLKNIVGKSLFDFHGVLEQDQMAPPGFLVLERLMVRLPLDVSAAARLLPLLCGVASVFLMRSVARRYLDRRAVPVAVALFALGDHLLYYSAEIKQYSCDLVLALACALPCGAKIASRVDAGPARGGLRLRTDCPLVLVLGGVRPGGGWPALAGHGVDAARQKADRERRGHGAGLAHQLWRLLLAVAIDPQ